MEPPSGKPLISKSNKIVVTQECGDLSHPITHIFVTFFSLINIENIINLSFVLEFSDSYQPIRATSIRDAERNWPSLC